MLPCYVFDVVGCVLRSACIVRLFVCWLGGVVARPVLHSSWVVSGLVDSGVLVIYIMDILMHLPTVNPCIPSLCIYCLFGWVHVCFRCRFKLKCDAHSLEATIGSDMKYIGLIGR